MSTLRIYLRRSRADDGHQEFSIDVQRRGCQEFAATLGPREGCAFSSTAEYLDDGLAGDDFIGRAGLIQLLKDCQPGDVVLTRDQARLGRDALEVTLAIRQLTKEQHTRVFFYADGTEARGVNVLDQGMTFFRGMASQMEVEAIRSRTCEALRARVKDGFVAGGRCYGYKNERVTDGSGRSRTRAVIDPTEAAVVREIFSLYRDGLGLKRIASCLNERGVPSVSVKVVAA